MVFSPQDRQLLNQALNKLNTSIASLDAVQELLAVRPQLGRLNDLAAQINVTVEQILNEVRSYSEVATQVSNLADDTKTGLDGVQSEVKET